MWASNDVSIEIEDVDRSEMIVAIATPVGTIEMQATSRFSLAAG